MNDLPLDGTYLKLLRRLIVHFPELVTDKEFIELRCDAANEEFEKALLRGSSVGEANNYFDEVLFSGLYFSKHDTLMEALHNLYPDGNESNLRIIAKENFTECLPFFEGYTIDDAFETSLEYENELLPAIIEYFKEQDYEIDFETHSVPLKLS